MIAPSRRWPLANWLALAAVLLGAGLAVVGVFRVLGPKEEAPPDLVESPIRDVALGAPSDATAAQWIAQDRIVRTNDGRLVLLYAVADGLMLVSDQANQGRSWRSPLALPGIQAESFAVAIDSSDRLHIAFHESSGVHYATAEERATGWTTSDPLELDATTTSAVVDIAWDEENDIAHVVWSAQVPEGERPQWSAVSNVDRQLSEIDSESLAPAGDSVTVLANIAVSDVGQLLATYRRGDATAGWFSRSMLVGALAEQLEWGAEERLPTRSEIDGAALSFDAAGSAQLILLDSTRTRLAHFTRNPRTGWSSGRTAVDANAINHIDLPVISIDQDSRLMYLFFETKRRGDPAEIEMAVRDPATGWEGPYGLATADSIGTGARYPIASATSYGQVVVLWTAQQPDPTIQAGRVTAP